MGFFRRREQDTLDPAKARAENWQDIQTTARRVNSTLQRLMSSEDKPPILNTATLEIPETEVMQEVGPAPDNLVFKFTWQEEGPFLKQVSGEKRVSYKRVKRGIITKGVEVQVRANGIRVNRGRPFTNLDFLEDKVIQACNDPMTFKKEEIK